MLDKIKLLFFPLEAPDIVFPMLLQPLKIQAMFANGNYNRVVAGAGFWHCPWRQKIQLNMVFWDFGNYVMSLEDTQGEKGIIRVY